MPISAEMAEIGIERLAACHAQEHCTKRIERDDAVVQQEVHTVIRVKRQQYVEVLPDMPKPSAGDGGEPNQRDRAEQGGDLCRAARLRREQCDQAVSYTHLTLPTTR